MPESNPDAPLTRADIKALQENQTPNVRIENPNTRKLVGNIIGWAGVLVTATTIVDQSIPAIDLAWLTIPAGSIVLGFLSLFQTLITSPNVPTV